MVQPVYNAFQEFVFESEQEIKTSKLLTYENLCMIRNLIAAEARARLNMSFDPLNPLAEFKKAFSKLPKRLPIK